jgi:hypothetical protein
LTSESTTIAGLLPDPFARLADGKIILQRKTNGRLQVKGVGYGRRRLGHGGGQRQRQQRAHA